jgi:hypothetical protein
MKEVSELRQQVLARVEASEVLRPHKDFIMMGKGNHHWLWLINVSEQEILEWEADVRAQIEGREYMNQLASRLAEQEMQS